MANLINHKSGRRSTQFYDLNENRRTLSLGRMAKRSAETIKMRIEYLLAAKWAGHALDTETAQWLSGLSQQFYKKLADLDLVPEKEFQKLAGFLESYINDRTDVKPLTIAKYKTTQRYLTEHFGSDINLREITAGDTDKWNRFLLSKGMASNTSKKHIATAKVFFQAALRGGMIDKNPFEGLKSTIQPNKSRFYFVSFEESQKAIDSCPDAEQSLIFAISRFGGLRCPSEHLSLRWEHVNWAQGRIQVPSPKTEHREGKESRIIPIFPELRPHLEDAYQIADEGSEYVISRYREKNSNLRTQLCRILRKVGITPWPKLFQNLRSTRQTELAESFPSHVVCE